jgi:hypothetical protein
LEIGFQNEDSPENEDSGNSRNIEIKDKKMKKILTLMLFVFGLSLGAVEDIERVLIEKAETPEQKKVVKEYLLKIAKEHEELAKRYRSMSVATKGGKAVYQSKKKAEMEELAEKFEADAKIYRAEAAKLK